MTTSLLPLQPVSPEQGAWDDVRSGWKLLYGGFATCGVSVEMHEFETDPKNDLDWGRSFHPQSVEVCLNLAGSGRLRTARDSRDISGPAMSWYATGEQPPSARRAAGEKHRFLTVEFQQQYLARQLADAGPAVEPVVRRSGKGKRGVPHIGEVKRLTSAQVQLAQRLAEPPVPAAALPLWFEAKVLEIIAEFFFVPDPELFCHRQQRLARERIGRVQEILRLRLDAPPSLEELGREVGVSQYYLSRMFSQEVQMTIPQYVRQIRMERAATLLRAGTHNVTEAAFAVGYSSLGHFSKSFCEVIGCCPTLYPLAKNLLPRR